MSGKLTAEQVRKSIESRFDFDVWVPNARWQAIADELNAAMGGGECENLIDAWSVHDVSQPDFECSECHATGHADGSVTGGEYLFCPRCGKAVKR